MWNQPAAKFFRTYQFSLITCTVATRLANDTDGNVACSRADCVHRPVLIEEGKLADTLTIAISTCVREVSGSIISYNGFIRLYWPKLYRFHDFRTNKIHIKFDTKI